MRIIEELMEIWPNEVCDRRTLISTSQVLQAYLFGLVILNEQNQVGLRRTA